MAHIVKKQEPEHTRDVTPHYEEIELDSPKSCDHFFEFVTSSSIKCNKCHVGFYIGQGDYIENGHLYHSGNLVI